MVEAKPRIEGSRSPRPSARLATRLRIVSMISAVRLPSGRSGGGSWRNCMDPLGSTVWRYCTDLSLPGQGFPRYRLTLEKGERDEGFDRRMGQRASRRRDLQRV